MGSCVSMAGLSFTLAIVSRTGKLRAAVFWVTQNRNRQQHLWAGQPSARVDGDPTQRPALIIKDENPQRCRCCHPSRRSQNPSDPKLQSTLRVSFSLRLTEWHGEYFGPGSARQGAFGAPELYGFSAIYAHRGHAMPLRQSRALRSVAH